MFGRVCVRGPVLVVVVILYVGEMAGDGREKAYEQPKINLLKLFLTSALESFLGWILIRAHRAQCFSNWI